MKSFNYIARDSLGARKQGSKQAATSNDVLNWLREQSLTPVSVTEIAQSVKQNRQTSHKKHIKSADLAALCWQLTTMVEGGIPITTAIDTLAADVENLQLRQIMQQVVEKMEKGETFSGSLAQFPKIFNQLSCAMILAGETGGNLAESLRRLAEYFDNRDELTRKVKGAMAYPIFVVVFIVVIVIFMMTFIVPRFRGIFDQFGGDLPAFTKLFMGFYDMLRFNLAYIIAGVIAMVVFASAMLKTPKGHYLFCKIALGFPLLGKVVSQAFIAIFCRTMATLLASGVSVLEVLDILSTMTNNDIIKSSILQTKERVVGGVNVSLGLAASGFFPNMVVKMVQVGEESGSMSKVLDRTADYYERKVDSLITTIMGLLEPIMIVTVGAIVLVVVLALYLPIFSMSDI